MEALPLSVSVSEVKREKESGGADVYLRNDYDRGTMLLYSKNKD